MDKKSNYRSESGYNQKKPSGRKNHIIRRNQKKQNEITGSPKGIGKGQRTGMRRQQNSIYR